MCCTCKAPQSYWTPGLRCHSTRVRLTLLSWFVAHVLYSPNHGLNLITDHDCGLFSGRTINWAIIILQTLMHPSINRCVVVGRRRCGNHRDVMLWVQHCIVLAVL